MFDPSVISLTQFRRGHNAGVDFLYVPPSARDRALAEVTSFAPKAPSRATLAAWLDAEIAACGASRHMVLREEQGALPMEVGYREPALPHVTHIGLAGGAARPSTGYAFQRIQAQTEAVVEGLLREGVARVPQDGRVCRFMDRVFLRVLRGAPSRGPALFDGLFRNAPPDRLERFLSGSTHPSDRLSVMTSLPTMPFLRAAAGLT